MVTSGPSIRVADVTKRFETDSGTVTALQDVDLTVEPGEFLGVVGPSGCGKTTLLRLLAGLDEPTSGHVWVGDDRVTEPGSDRGVVFQDAGLFPWRTVAGNVRFGLEQSGRDPATADRRVQELLEMVGLADRADAYPDELSGGMRERVGIARALAVDPDILLLDEPFGNLDAFTRETLQRDLLSIWEGTGKTVVFVTHATGEAVTLADRVVVFESDPGRVGATVDVDLARPRTPDHPGFQRYKRRIVDHVRGESTQESANGPWSDVSTDDHQTSRSTEP